MKNFIKKLILCLGLTSIFLLLILFNLKKAQRDIAQSTQPLYKISLINPTLNASADEPIEFSWDIQAPDTAISPSTTIYYGHVSSPSALTTNDSPQAVGYPYKLTDYLNGSFFLPDTFSTSVNLLPGTIFYRAYARVGSQHLWSSETKLVIHK